MFSFAFDWSKASMALFLICADFCFAECLGCYSDCFLYDTTDMQPFLTIPLSDSCLSSHSSLHMYPHEMLFESTNNHWQHDSQSCSNRTRVILVRECWLYLLHLFNKKPTNLKPGMLFFCNLWIFKQRNKWQWPGSDIFRRMAFRRLDCESGTGKHRSSTFLGTSAKWLHKDDNNQLQPNTTEVLLAHKAIIVMMRCQCKGDCTS